MSDNERIVCEFLRKIAPSREWEYLGEVEHYWIGELCNELNDQLKAENAKLREGLAVSIPLPLDGNRSAIHPDDIIGNNFGGTDFFGRVTEMHLTRYPRDGQPAMWVVKTEDDDGNVTPYVCWGGRCHAVHKKASQTYSAEYLDTYDENRRLKAENAKLRKLVLDVHAIGWSGFDCTECPVSFSGRCENNGGCNWLGILTDRMRELGIEVPE